MTVLVCGCDVFESQAYLEDLDAEGQSDALRAFQQACEEAVFPFDGTIVQCNEQGLLVCFGYPVAREDAARRGAQAGLGLREAMKVFGVRLRRDHKLEFNPWVGIHTGSAVAETGENAVSLVGEARNVAVRLQDVAEPGQVLITAATRRLIRGGFDGTSVGLKKIKGVTQPVELFLVRAVGEDRNVIEAAEGVRLTPLLGRDHEISLLKDRWEQAQEGMGHVVLISGEPGLGKSRLVHSIKQYVREQARESGGGAGVGRSPVRGRRPVFARARPSSDGVVRRTTRTAVCTQSATSSRDRSASDPTTLRRHSVRPTGPPSRRIRTRPSGRRAAVCFALVPAAERPFPRTGPSSAS